MIERTIIDIDQIKNKGKTTCLICDTNSMDLRVNNDLRLWNKFLGFQNVNINYKIVQ